MAFKAKPIPLDLSRRCRNRVQSIGIELEGGWEKLPPRTELVRDGSVHGLERKFPADKEVRYQELYVLLNNQHGLPAQRTEYETLYRLRNGGGLHVGELPSPVLTLTEWETWMRKFYPHAVNSTCGMHVHMSFKHALMYQRLMVESYPATVVEEFHKWALAKKIETTSHPIWERLLGMSEFTAHSFWPDSQVKQRQKEYDHHATGNRYSVINYCYGRFQTLECRLLPMFGCNEAGDVEMAIEAIKHLILITNIFLVTTRGREMTYSASYLLNDPDHREEIHECV